MGLLAQTLSPDDSRMLTSPICPDRDDPLLCQPSIHPVVRNHLARSVFGFKREGCINQRLTSPSAGPHSVSQRRAHCAGNGVERGSYHASRSNGVGLSLRSRRMPIVVPVTFARKCSGLISMNGGSERRRMQSSCTRPVSVAKLLNVSERLETRKTRRNGGRAPLRKNCAEIVQNNVAG